LVLERDLKGYLESLILSVLGEVCTHVPRKVETRVTWY